MLTTLISSRPLPPRLTAWASARLNRRWLDCPADIIAETAALSIGGEDRPCLILRGGPETVVLAPPPWLFREPKARRVKSVVCAKCGAVRNQYIVNPKRIAACKECGGKMEQL